MKKRVTWGLLGAVAVGVLYACSSDDANNQPHGGGDASTDGESLDSAPSDGGADGESDGGLVCTTTPCILQIAAGYSHACAVAVDGTVRCWGANEDGQLGIGGKIDGGPDDGGSHRVPVLLDAGGVSQVATGGYGFSGGFSCARMGTTQLQCWGRNGSLELGRGDASAGIAATPDRAPVVGLSQVASVTTANSSVFVTTGSPGTAISWGSNEWYTLGRDVPTLDPNPKPVTTEAGVTVSVRQVSANAMHACAVLDSGDVACWGFNGDGAVGPQADPGGAGVTIYPSVVAGTNGAAEVAAGGDFTCMLRQGVVSCWGKNDHGQLGRGTVTDHEYDVHPIALNGVTFRHLGRGAYHTCAISDSGALYCWGDNLSRQIVMSPDGGAPNYVPDPAPIAGLPGKVIQMVGGFDFSCVIVEGGEVDCWGHNFSGQCGRSPTKANYYYESPGRVQF